DSPSHPLAAAAAPPARRFGPAARDFPHLPPSPRTRTRKTGSLRSPKTLPWRIPLNPLRPSLPPGWPLFFFSSRSDVRRSLLDRAGVITLASRLIAPPGVAGMASSLSRNSASIPSEVRMFFRDIKEHPDDDTPRLIFADWLQEHGDAAAAARGEFLR